MSSMQVLSGSEGGGLSRARYKRARASLTFANETYLTLIYMGKRTDNNDVGVYLYFVELCHNII